LSDAGGTWACKAAWKRKEDTQKHDRLRPKDGEEGKKPIPAKTYTVRPHFEDLPNLDAG
jgi:hypothetical protein